MVAGKAQFSPLAGFQRPPFHRPKQCIHMTTKIEKKRVQIARFCAKFILYLIEYKRPIFS
jgi:hypothetical protein